MEDWIPAGKVSAGDGQHAVMLSCRFVAGSKRIVDISGASLTQTDNKNTSSRPNQLRDRLSKNLMSCSLGHYYSAFKCKIWKSIFYIEYSAFSCVQGEEAPEIGQTGPVTGVAYKECNWKVPYKVGRNGYTSIDSRVWLKCACDNLTFCIVYFGLCTCFCIQKVMDSDSI